MDTQGLRAGGTRAVCGGTGAHRTHGTAKNTAVEGVEQGHFRPFSGQSCAVCLVSILIPRPLQLLLCRWVSVLPPPAPAAFSKPWGFLLVSVVQQNMSARTSVLTSMFHSSCVTPPTHQDLHSCGPNLLLPLGVCQTLPCALRLKTQWWHFQVHRPACFTKGAASHPSALPATAASQSSSP